MAPEFTSLLLIVSHVYHINHIHHLSLPLPSSFWTTLTPSGAANKSLATPVSPGWPVWWALTSRFPWHSWSWGKTYTLQAVWSASWTAPRHPGDATWSRGRVNAPPHPKSTRSICKQETEKTTNATPSCAAWTAPWLCLHAALLTPPAGPAPVGERAGLRVRNNSLFTPLSQPGFMCPRSPCRELWALENDRWGNPHQAGWRNTQAGTPNAVVLTTY